MRSYQLYRSICPTRIVCSPHPVHGSCNGTRPLFHAPCRILISLPPPPSRIVLGTVSTPPVAGIDPIAQSADNTSLMCLSPDFLFRTLLGQECCPSLRT